MYKIAGTIFILGVVVVIIMGINLGRFIDVTQPPKKADLIVSLGGDSGCRIRKAVSLYQQGFSRSQQLLYTGNDSISKQLEPSQSKQQYLRRHGLQSINCIHIDTTQITNTMEEVYFVKQYMQAHHYRRVIFVSHPHHSRRVATLAKWVADYKRAGLTFMVVSCEPSWWNASSYYQNETAVKASLREVAKLLYNIVKYATPLRYYTSYIKENKQKKWAQTIATLK